MDSIAGNWTGSFEGTNSGGIAFSVNQNEKQLTGVATMYEAGIGVYAYTIWGEVGANIRLQLRPLVELRGQIFGVIDVTCSIGEGGVLEGTWQSSIGTNGVFSARRYQDANAVDSGVVRPKNVFVSYSRIDKNFLDELLVHLRPLEHAGLVDAWSDQRIKASQMWKQEIQAALGRAQVAILMISPDFLASDFIVNNELPPILAGARSGSISILPVILRPCRFVRDPHLGAYQAINDPWRPLASLQRWERDAVFDRIAHEIEQLGVRC